ncbi:MAG: hypothetical protein ACI8RZ_002866 [Myxococcota bacterium]|jgi:hypothetical protein
MFKRCLLMFAVIQLGYSGLTWACVCGTEGGSEDFDKVFVGVADRGTGGCGEQHHTPFVVSEPIKGVTADESVTLHHSAESTSCGMVFESGDTWLIMTNDGSYSICAPGEQDPSEETIAALYDEVAD